MAKLPKEVASKYKMLPGHAPGEYVYQGHRVDLRSITLAAADALVENGFSYLVPKKQRGVAL